MLSVQLANKRGFKQKKLCIYSFIPSAGVIHGFVLIQNICKKKNLQKQLVNVFQ
jgi:hypothetical protein